MIFACADDGKTDEGADEVGDGDGDRETGDGDRETGDGDGEPTGDGDGEPTGDGDGEPTGDGDGETGETGEANECQTTADLIAPEIAQPEGGCTIIVRFDYQSLMPKAWTSHCAKYPAITLEETDARKATDCCSDGVLLDPTDKNLFMLYSDPDPDGGISVISNHLAELSFEGTIGETDDGEITHPKKWATPDNLGSGCAAAVPQGDGYDLTRDGEVLAQEQLDAVLEAFADTALTQAIEQNGKILRTVTLLYAPAIDPFDATKGEYVMIIESGT